MNGFALGDDVRAASVATGLGVARPVLLQIANRRACRSSRAICEE